MSHTPIVLAHGMGGYGQKDPLNDVIDYFSGIVDLYEQQGVEAYCFSVNPFGSVKECAEELFDQQKKEVGERPVHYVAHSKGGLDTRYIVSPQGLDRSDYCSSLTTIAAPHRGAALADILLHLLPFKLADKIIGEERVDNFFQRRVRPLIKDSLGFRYLEDLLSSNAAALRDLSVAHMRNHFNNPTSERYVGDSDDVQYFSYVAHAPVHHLTRHSLSLFIPKVLLHAQDGPNDGLVSVESQKYGKVLGTIKADHWEQVGIGGRFDHRKFFVDIGEHLRYLDGY